MIIKGYKAFNKDMTNRYGIPFECGKTYKVDGDIKFGNEGNGYHFCSSIADVFRYVDASDINNYVVAEVYGIGDYKVYDDEYEGYYDMYSFRSIYIKRILTREQVFEKIKTLSEWQILKIIKTSKLSSDEILYICKKYKGNVTIMCAILYYQLDQKDIYEKYYREYKINIIEENLEIKKVLLNG